MSNTINPYGASRSDLQRSVQPELEDEALRPENKRTEGRQTPGKTDAELAGTNEKIDPSSARDQANPADASTQSARFDSTLEDAIDKSDASRAGDTKIPQKLDGLSSDEQSMIYRYFPESPSLELRLYKQDMSAKKVDPGSVGSRVDIRG